jgi:hypothetical protein
MPPLAKKRLPFRAREIVEADTLAQRVAIGGRCFSTALKEACASPARLVNWEL